MTTTTMTFRNDSAFDALTARLSLLSARLINTAVAMLTPFEAREPTNAVELLEWADQYEATQPSYAADLRAAARRHLD